MSYRQGGILREIYRLNEPRQDIYYQEVPDGSFLRIDASARAINTRLKFPAVSGNLSIRWCSSTVKIDVLAAAIRRHPAYSRDVVVLTGERREESKVRSGYKAIDRYSAATKKRRAVLWRPLLGWSSADVWAILARWKVQPHPAYMLGWTRCSCQLCIFGSVNIWATLQLMAPHKIEAIARIEQEIGFTLFPGTTIKDYVSRGVALPAQSAYWVQQATGSFTAPVRLDDWRWPPGAFGKESAGAS
ncbi:phosphoadenosine phosphosulfate reductase family protein [Puia sp.]|uniref:phosphoadenosine phosphosulfate reductase domain-containing protein n=1 Tax=Puia sp. TaxID=2045100 RepID=UPI002D80F5C9|nr:phosphoadenosine phosphosulfate reductase family protein [Puia sp.]